MKLLDKLAKNNFSKDPLIDQMKKEVRNFVISVSTDLSVRHTKKFDIQELEKEEQITFINFLNSESIPYDRNGYFVSLEPHKIKRAIEIRKPFNNPIKAYNLFCVVDNGTPNPCSTFICTLELPEKESDTMIDQIQYILRSEHRTKQYEFEVSLLLKNKRIDKKDDGITLLLKEVTLYNIKGK